MLGMRVEFPRGARCAARTLLPRLKQPFTRRDEARGAEGGAGLGLAIVDRIARSHGGSLEFRPREGGGLVARMVLHRR